MTTGKIDAAKIAEWRQSPASFCQQALGDPETGKPFVLLPSERLFFEHCFKTDEQGRLLYPEQCYGAIKKSGKTTFAALHALTTTLLFGGRYPETICIANSLEQSVGRVYECVRKIVETSPWLKRQAHITQDRITFPSIGATIRAIPSDYGSAAGSNQNLAIFDELWAFETERAHRLFDEMVPPPTRKVACRLTTTYAGFSGESELLEGLYKRGLAQPLVGKDLYAGDGLLMFWSHEPVAPWQTPAWIDQMRRSLRPNQFLRMIENRFVSSESQFVDLAAWDACCVLPGPLVRDESLPVFCGVDASTRRDSTALCAVAYQGQCVQLVAHKVFVPAPDRPINFEVTVENTLREWRRRFHLQRVLFDPYQLASVMQRLAAEGLPVEEYPQTLGNLTATTSGLFDLISARQLALYPDAGMRLAVARAVVTESSRGWKLDKLKQAHHIDVVVALSMACLAAVRDGGRAAYDLDMSWIDGDGEHAGLSPRALDMAEKREYAMMQMRNYVLSGGGTRPPWSY